MPALFWALLQVLCAAAQTSLADSLARVLVTAQADTNRVNLLNEIAWEINETRTDEAAQRLQESINLAQKLKFTKGEASAWNGLGVVEENRGNYTAAHQNYQKALDLRNRLGDLGEIGATLNNIGVLLETTGHFDSALVYHRKNLAIQEKLRDTVKIARVYFNLAGVYLEKGVYLKAQESLYQARGILEAQNDQDGVAKVTTQLGHIRTGVRSI